MKSIILAAAVVAFELAFVASIASSPTGSPGAASAVTAPASRSVAQRGADPVPCTPPG